MDVAPVGVHGALAVGDAADEGKGGVKDGQSQNQEWHRKGDDGIKLEQALDGHGGQDVTQEGGAGVAHEHLGGVHVVGHEAHAGPHQGRHHHSHLKLPADEGNYKHCGGGDGGDAVGQAVQAVDQVHRVGDGNNPKHRQGHGEISQHPIGIVRKDVGVGKRLDHHAVGGGDQGGHDLHHKFQQRRQGHDVVHHAQHHDDDGSQQDAAHLGRDLHKQQDADHEADKDGQSPQPGDGSLVHPAGVLGYVDGPHLVSKSLDDGRHQKADDQRHQQRQQRIGDQPVFDQHDVSSITGAGSPPFYRPCSGSGWLHRPPSPHRRGRRSPDSSCPPAGAPSPPGWAAAAPPRTHPPPA